MLTNIDIINFCKPNIPFFRVVFMRVGLPNQPRKRECGIINLDKSVGNGTHWVAYQKSGEKNCYYDSFTNLQPPIEIIKYLGKNICYNYNCEQKFHTYNCGHLCINFLLQNVNNY